MAKGLRTSQSARVPVFVWVLLLVLAGAVTFRALSSRSGSHHPTPRADVTAADVVPASRYAEAHSIQQAYEFAKRYPQVLDGLYCYCECARNFGHRSLLTCFESDHGADCEICLREAIIAGQMHEQGKSLDEIRGAIDGMFRG